MPSLPPSAEAGAPLLVEARRLPWGNPWLGALKRSATGAGRAPPQRVQETRNRMRVRSCAEVSDPAWTGRHDGAEQNRMCRTGHRRDIAPLSRHGLIRQERECNGLERLAFPPEGLERRYGNRCEHG